MHGERASTRAAGLCRKGRVTKLSDSLADGRGQTRTTPFTESKMGLVCKMGLQERLRDTKVG